MSLYILKNEDVIERCIGEIRQSLGMQVKISERKRTLPQNAYFHSLNGIIARSTGESDNLTKVRLKDKVLEWQSFINSDGEQKFYLPSSTDLSVSEFGDLIEVALEVGGILGLTMPTPRHYGLDT